MNYVYKGRRDPIRMAKSVVVDGRDTTLWIETAIWDGLQDIAAREETTTGMLLTMIARRCPKGANFHSGIRCFVLAYYKSIRGTEGVGQAPARRRAVRHLAA